MPHDAIQRLAAQPAGKYHWPSRQIGDRGECSAAAAARVCQFWRVSRIVFSGHRARRFVDAGEAAAQAAASEDAASLQAQKDALFQRMLRDPANLDVTFKYADVAARLGDYEAAVFGALSGCCCSTLTCRGFNLELGVLYFRMGSYGLARDYFDRAAAANPPPEIRGRLDQYMAEIEKGESRHRLSGYFFSGVQYQTNANVAGSSVILSPIGPVLLQQPTHQASVREHLRQRFSALQLRFARRRAATRSMSPGPPISTIISILWRTGSTSPCSK